MGSRVRGTGCPDCYQIRTLTPSSGESLHEMHPAIASLWDYQKNPTDVSPITIKANSKSRQFYWKCDKNPEHEWSATIVQQLRIAL